MGQEQPYC
jgi:hypothetical protein